LVIGNWFLNCIMVPPWPNIAPAAILTMGCTAQAYAQKVGLLRKNGRRNGVI
jgi:hypothetical protein